MAQDSAKITQYGEGHNATIEQVATGGTNSAAVYQGAGWYGGYGNQATLMQRGVDGSQIEVHQSGGGNYYQVAQYDGRNLAARVNVESSWYGDFGGNSNQVTIEQSGFDSLASVEQGNSSYSRAEIMQNGGWSWGGGNRAEIVQSGANNQASIQQSGSNFSASIVQGSQGYGYGNGNVATIRQGH